MPESLTPPVVFKCLADETRARMTLLLARKGELCVCELTCALELSQPKISRHLAQLREAGLLMDRRQGQWVYYRLHPSLPTWVVAMLDSVVAASEDWLRGDVLRLAAMGERPDQVVCAP